MGESWKDASELSAPSGSSGYWGHLIVDVAFKDDTAVPWLSFNWGGYAGYQRISVWRPRYSIFPQPMFDLPVFSNLNAHDWAGKKPDTISRAGPCSHNYTDGCALAAYSADSDSSWIKFAIFYLWRRGRHSESWNDSHGRFRQTYCLLLRDAKILGSSADNHAADQRVRPIRHNRPRMDLSPTRLNVQTP
ncbi:hypothetical protein BJX76DRAFT_96008 [Aspergillus varians]